MKKVKLMAAVICLNLVSFASFAQDGEDKVKQAFEMFNNSQEAFNAANYDEAIKLGLGSLELVKDKPEGSEPVIENVGKLVPQYYYSKAASQLKANQFIDALSTLEKGQQSAISFKNTEMEKQINDLKPQVGLAQAGAFLNEKKADEAIKYADDAILHGSTSSQAYLIKAMAYSLKSDNAKSEEMLIKTTEVAKANSEQGQLDNANAQLASLYLKNAVAAQKANKWADVMDNADKSLTYKESNNAYKLKAAGAAKLNKWDDVIAAWTPLANDDKDKGAANYNLAVAYQKKGNNAKACEHYKKASADAKYKANATAQLAALKCS